MWSCEGPDSSDRSAVSLGHLMKKNSGEMTVLQRSAGSVLFVRDGVVDLNACDLF